MILKLNRRRGLETGCALSALALLAACGGGGGGGGVISAPAPVPTPTPTPAPVPTPTPTPPATGIDTAEYRRSTGPAFHNAATAWAAGASGKGAKIAIVDTGIDLTNPEFSGRIDPASTNVAGTGSAQQVDDHGTQVALVAAAARNNVGVVGIAYEATVLALRADKPGSCPTDCSLLDRDIAAGIDRAVANGATVINLSLGGDPPTQTLLGSIQRASAAGIVIVVSAGNEGDGKDPTIDPNQPNPFAAAVRDAGGANVIIAGSVNAQSQISAFSNRAGTQAPYYLAALGERICCVYENGVLKTTTDASGTFVTLVSGTSFSAPQIAGAVALLRQAFPSLTAAQMVDILLKSARDAGAAGTDAIYGRGILDIAAAFAPRGATTLAGGTTMVALGDDTGVVSPAMGDAARTASLGSVILDSYGRAYGYDLGKGLAGASLAPRLLGAIDSGSRQVATTAPGAAMAFTLADGQHAIAPLRLAPQDAAVARVLAARVALRLAPGRQIGFAFRESGEGLVAQLQGQERPAFLIAGEARGSAGFADRPGMTMAYRQQFGRWGVTASAGQGQAWLGGLRVEDGRLERQREARGLRNFAIAADRRFGSVEANLGVGWLREDRTVLGAYFGDAFGAGGASTLFVDAGAGWRPGEGWRIGGAVRQGWTRADRTGPVGAGSNLVSRAWSADVARNRVFGRGDSLALRVSQPLRVESGGLNLMLPVGYDYATLLPTFGVRSLALAPRGREIDGEIAWRGPLWGGDAAASLYYRSEPGHVAAMPADKGAAVKWSRRF